MAATFYNILVISSLALLPTLEANGFKVGGNIAVTFCPLNKYNEINLEYISTYAGFLNDKHIQGVVVGSGTGEGPTLNVTDTMTLIDAWVKAASQFNLTIVVSIGGGMSLPDVIKTAAYANKKRVDCLMVRSDAFYRAQSARAVLSYVERVANAAPDTPIIYEEIYEDSCGDVDIVEFFELATEKICNFRGVKSSKLETLLLLQSRLKGDLKVFAGSNRLLGAEVLLGFQDYMLEVLSLFPKMALNIMKTGKTCRRGSREMTLALYQKLRDLIDIIYRGGKPIAVMKKIMLLGHEIDLGGVRPPLIPLTEIELFNLKRRLIAKGFPIAKTRDCELDK